MPVRFFVSFGFGLRCVFVVEMSLGIYGLTQLLFIQYLQDLIYFQYNLFVNHLRSGYLNNNGLYPFNQRLYLGAELAPIY